MTASCFQHKSKMKGQSIVILFILFATVQHSQSGYTVLFKFMKFDNTGGLAYEKNTKCDGAEIFHRCETYFEICLQPGSDQPTNFSNCWYYLNTSRTYIWKDNIDFQYNKVGVPKTIKLKINQSWPEGFGFYFKAWDWDNPNTFYSRLIDVHAFSTVLTAGANGSISEYRGRSVGQRPNQPATKLTFQIQVLCDLYYFGSTCENHCDADRVKGHSKCDRNGTLVCERDWHDAPKCDKFCVPQNDREHGHYTCSVNGTHVCRTGWFNPPTCNTSCIVQNDTNAGQWTCAKDGSLICADGWSGRYCNATLPFSTTTLRIEPSRSIKKPESSSFQKSLTRLSMSHFSASKSLVLSSHSKRVLSSGFISLSSMFHQDNSLQISSMDQGATVFSTDVSTATKYSERVGTLTERFLPSAQSVNKRTSRIEEAIAQSSLLKRTLSTGAVLPSTSHLEQSTGRNLKPSEKTESLESRKTSFLIALPTTVMQIPTSTLSSQTPSVSKTLNQEEATTIVPSSKPCGTPMNTERKGINEDLKWMMNTPRGNMTLIGFGLALLFFVFLVVAICKIHRLKRNMVEKVKVKGKKKLRNNPTFGFELLQKRYSGIDDHGCNIQENEKCKDEIGYVNKSYRISNSINNE